MWMGVVLERVPGPYYQGGLTFKQHVFWHITLAVGCPDGRRCTDGYLPKSDSHDPTAPFYTARSDELPVSSDRTHRVSESSTLNGPLHA